MFIRVIPVLVLDRRRLRRSGPCSAPALACLGLFGALSANAQVGPFSPGSMSNNTAVGSNAWSSAANALSSNDSYATVATKGISNYLVASSFGFNIPSPANILGIRLDVERSTLNPQNVALLDGWTTGLTKSISTGADRCLLVTYCQENGTNSRDLTAMTYGGRSMTQLIEYSAGTSGGFMARIEVWILLESELALAGSTTIVPTFGTYTPLEYCEAFSSASFQYVDQNSPLYSQANSGAQGTTNPHQLGSAINTLAGSMAINLATCGNNTTPGISNGGTNTYTIGSGYTEGTDLYFANTSVAPTTGACFQTAHKAISSNGSEQPSCTFAGSVNRWAMVGFVLRRRIDRDHEIRLLKGDVITGSNLASTSEWPASDGTAVYGGATELWGTTWTVSDINSATFGAALSADVRNGTARVDHMTVTVYYQSTLPIELLDLRAVLEGDHVRITWTTATETNNDHFVIQRSRDGITFDDLGYEGGAGTSVSTLHYSGLDEDPLPGTSFYRLKQVDIDGTATLSHVVAVSVAEEDQIMVHPNPVLDGVFTVEGIRLERDQVVVYTSDMRPIRTHVGAGLDPVIHIEDLPDGTYILLVRTGEDIRTTRIVKASRMR